MSGRDLLGVVATDGDGPRPRGKGAGQVVVIEDGADALGEHGGIADIKEQARATMLDHAGDSAGVGADAGDADSLGFREVVGAVLDIGRNDVDVRAEKVPDDRVAGEVAGELDAVGHAMAAHAAVDVRADPFVADGAANDESRVWMSLSDQCHRLDQTRGALEECRGCRRVNQTPLGLAKVPARLMKLRAQHAILVKIRAVRIDGTHMSAIPVGTAEEVTVASDDSPLMRHTLAIEEIAEHGRRIQPSAPGPLELTPVVWVIGIEDTLERDDGRHGEALGDEAIAELRAMDDNDVRLLARL